MAERDKLIRFWINHHINNKEPTKCNNSNNNKNNINNDKNQNNGEDMTLTLSLYLKIKQYERNIDGFSGPSPGSNLYRVLGMLG